MPHTSGKGSYTKKEKVAIKKEQKKPIKGGKKGDKK
jgi:hypothetical protein